jgi:hypothetical protein
MKSYRRQGKCRVGRI